MKRFLIASVVLVFAALLAFFLSGRDTKLGAVDAVANKPVVSSIPRTPPQQGVPVQLPETAELNKPANQPPPPNRPKGSGEAKFELAAQELAKRPELKAALDNNLRRLIREAYGDLESLLGIDRVAARRVIDLFYERELLGNDAAAVMRERGIPVGHPDYDSVLRGFYQEFDAKIRATVGEDKFQLLQIAPQVQEKQLELAKYYGGEFREIDAPLSPDQSLQLAIAMAQYSVRDAELDPVQTGAGPNQYLRGKSEVPLLIAASKILTPAQCEVLRRRLVEENMQKEFGRQLKEEIWPLHGLK